MENTQLKLLIFLNLLVTTRKITEIFQNIKTIKAVILKMSVGALLVRASELASELAL